MIRSLLSAVFSFGIVLPTWAEEPGIRLDRWGFRMDLSQAKLPGNETLGITSFTLAAEGPSGFYLGPSLQAAFRGQRGGFFAGGLLGGLRHSIAPRLALDGGLFLGGGGGAGAPVGGGFILRPHLGLLWTGPSARLGIGVAHLRFPNGEIRSHQAYFSLERSFSSLRLVGHEPAPEWQSLPFHADREFLELRATRYSRSGAPTPMDLLGAAWGRQLNDTFSFQVEAAAAARGSHSGYMEALGGMGARLFLDEGRRFSLRGVLSAGSGGGGGLGTGGGFLVKGRAGLHFQISPAVHLVTEVGHLSAPSTSFRATSFSLGAGFSLDSAAPRRDSKPEPFPAVPWLMKWRMSSGFQRYAAVTRKTGAPAAPLEQFVFKAEFLLSDQIYLTGQSGWATGGRAGAWATGLLGAGVQTPGFRGHRLRLELAGGAGGGGGVEAQGGALVQAMTGWNWDFSPSWSVYFMFGGIRSPRQGLSTSVVDLGLGFRGTRLVKIPSKL